LSFALSADFGRVGALMPGSGIEADGGLGPSLTGGSIGFGPGSDGATGRTGVVGTGSVFIGTFVSLTIGGSMTSVPAGFVCSFVSGKTIIGGDVVIGLAGGAIGVSKSIAGGGIASGLAGGADVDGLDGAGAGGVSRSINGGGAVDLPAFGAGPVSGITMVGGLVSIGGNGALMSSPLTCKSSGAGGVGGVTGSNTGSLLGFDFTSSAFAGTTGSSMSKSSALTGLTGAGVSSPLGALGGFVVNVGSGAGSFQDSFLSTNGGVAKTASPPTPIVSVQARTFQRLRVMANQLLSSR
jgi:hypothetical protein